jgi:hypothetical protein
MMADDKSGRPIKQMRDRNDQRQEKDEDPAE